MKNNLFWLVSKYRWPHLHSCYDLLQACEQLSYDAQKEIQLSRLLKIIEFAKNNNSYYTKILKCGLKDEIIVKDLHDLDLIPISSKNEIRKWKNSWEI